MVPYNVIQALRGMTLRALRSMLNRDEILVVNMVKGGTN